MTWYVAMLILRNCGRFLNLASDFGSSYKTHTFVSSEALYAGMTREQSRKQAKLIDLQNDNYNYEKFYTELFDWVKLPVLFTPGVFIYNELELLKKSRRNSDTNWFNVIAEDYPTTNKGTQNKTRPHYIPTYGLIESILPGYKLCTFALSKNVELLKNYEEGQTFLLGKKRTMFQIEQISEIKTTTEKEGGYTAPLQIQFDEIDNFDGVTVLAATKRYFLVMGNYKHAVVTADVDGFDFVFPIDVFPLNIYQ